MSPSYVCPCCFLNRISILRESGGSGEHVEIRFNHGESRVGVSSEALTVGSNTSVSTQLALSDDSQEFIMSHLDDVLEKLKSGASLTSGLSDQNMDYGRVSRMDSTNRKELLTEQIDNVLKEQKKFLKELNLEVPMYEEEWYMLMGDQRMLSKSGDSYCSKNSNQDFTKLLRKAEITNAFYASGDNVCLTSDKISAESLQEESSKVNKPTIYFNEEPIKLPKPFQCTLSSNDSNFNKDYVMDKNISVKLLFFPEVELKGSSTSMISDDCLSSASIYVTAANSVVSEQTPYMYNSADSMSNFQLKTTESSDLMG